MSWFRQPDCMPEELGLWLNDATKMCQSEMNALIECICDALESEETWGDGAPMAEAMCDEFIEAAQAMKAVLSRVKPFSDIQQTQYFTRGGEQCQRTNRGPEGFNAKRCSDDKDLVVLDDFITLEVDPED